MIKTLVTTLWVCVVATVACLGALSSGLLPTSTAATAVKAPGSEAFETLRIGQLSIPSLKDGVLAGYVVVRLSAVVALTRAKALQIKIEDLVTDEAFKSTYAVSVDPTSGHKPELDRFTSLIAERVNKRIGETVVKSVQIQEFTYVDRKDVRK